MSVLAFDFYNVGVSRSACHCFTATDSAVFGGVLFASCDNFAVTGLQAPAPTIFTWIYFKLCHYTLLLTLPFYNAPTPGKWQDKRILTVWFD